MQTAGAIAGEGNRKTAWGEIAQAYAAAGEFRASWEIVKQQLDPYPDDQVMAAVVAAQVRAEKREHEPLGEILEAIRQRVRVLEDGGDRQCMLGDVAVALAGVHAFTPALEVAGEIERDDRRADVLGAIAALQAKRGDRETACLTLAAALESTQKFSNPWWRVDAMVDTARPLLEAGEREMAGSVLALAATAARTIEDAGGRDDELRRIGKAQADARAFSAALETAQSIQERSERLAALAAIALAQAKSAEREAAQGTLALAGELIRQIEYPGGQSEASSLIARTHAQLGAFGTALETAHSMTDQTDRIEALREIALLQSATGDRASAHQTVAAAREIAGQMESSNWQSHALALVAALQARLGRAVDAVETAGAIRADCDEHWMEIADALAGAGDREAFKRLMLMGFRYPNVAGKLCLLLPRLYPEQFVSIQAIICFGGDR